MMLRFNLSSHTRPLLARGALLFSPVLMLCGTPSAAQETEQNERSWNLGIAFGSGKRDNPLISGDTIDVNYVIDFSWYGERFFFDNGDFGYTLFTGNALSFSVLGTISNERSYYSYLTGKQLSLDSLFGPSLLPDSSFSIAGLGLGPADKTLDPELLPGPGLPEDELTIRNFDTRLARRDYAANAGFELLYISPWGDLQAQVLSDVSSVHQGEEAWLSWTKPWYFADSQMSISVGLEWQSSALLSYYYGVTPDEAFTGRNAYEARSGTNRYLRWQARHSLSRHWQIVAMAEREFLSNAISQSPIVDTDRIDTFFTGLYYQF